MHLEGFAFPDSTKKLSEKYKEFKYNPLGKTDLLVSEVGFGSYRIDIRSRLNEDALQKALLAGINLIDTSSTYTDGNSELLIGDVLQKLTSSKQLSREQLVIVTKAGYLQGQNYNLSQLRKVENKPFSDLVEYQEGLEHCIHPEFLEDQITRSLGRLQIETIDVYLLHNPEYYLKWAKNNNIDLIVARKEYYLRIKKAFEYLEKEVQKGRIKHYGISSNTFPIDPDNFDFTSLETVIQIADGISKNNHFSVIEFPMNLAETGAYTNTNQSDNMTLLKLAENKNIGVLINRPLNAFYENKLILLTELLVDNPPSPQQINNEFRNLNQLKESIFKNLKLYCENKFIAEVEKDLLIFEALQNNWNEIGHISNWQAGLNQYFLPLFNYFKNFIENSSLKSKELKTDLFNYIVKIGNLFELITAYYNNEHLKLTNNIKKNLANSIPELSSATNISNMAIRSLRSTMGVTTVLVGMTQPSYVTDVINELKIPVNKNFNWDKINFENALKL